MTATPDCSQVRELAPELALGVASGGARASALTHLTRCGACRAHVSELSDVADGVLQADERGRIGERYILGNRNYTHDRLFADMARISGVEPPLTYAGIWPSRKRFTIPVEVA